MIEFTQCRLGDPAGENNMTLQRLVDDNPTQEGTKRVVAFITLKKWVTLIH